MPTGETISVVEAPNMEMTISAEMICGSARITSIDAHQHIVEPAAVVGGDQADRGAEDERRAPWPVTAETGSAGPRTGSAIHTS